MLPHEICDDLCSSKTESQNKKLTSALLNDDPNEFLAIFKKEGWPRYSEWSDYDLLLKAIKLKRKKIVNLLLDLGCRVYKKLNILTPLHLAATIQYWTDVVERLIKMNLRVAAKSNIGGGNGNTALHYAFYERFNDLDDTIDLLLTSHLQQGVGEVNIKNKDNLSFLHIACVRPNLDIVKTLLEADENSINLQDLQLLQTPLHYAVEYNRHQIAEFLLQSGADIYKQDATNSTPLHLALKCGDARMIDLLLVYDKRWKNVVNFFGMSHLMVACAGSDVKIVERYLHYDESPLDSINAPVEKTLGDLTGSTSLHIAVRYARAKTIKLLLDYGANCCATNFHGLTAHDLGDNQGYTRICQILQEHCSIVRKCIQMRSESPDFRVWGENYEKYVLNEKIKMFKYLDGSLKNLSCLSQKFDF